MKSDKVHEAELCKTLAHPTRLRILGIVQHEELTAGEITRRLGISKTSAAQHLALMRTQGILKARRVRNFVAYRLASEKLAQDFIMMEKVLTLIADQIELHPGDEYRSGPSCSEIPHE